VIVVDEDGNVFKWWGIFPRIWYSFNL